MRQVKQILKSFQTCEMFRVMYTLDILVLYKLTTEKKMTAHRLIYSQSISFQCDNLFQRYLIQIEVLNCLNACIAIFIFSYLFLFIFSSILYLTHNPISSS